MKHLKRPLLLPAPLLIPLLLLLPACGGKTDPVSGLGKVPDFHLLERAGVPVDLASLKGKVWVATFIFSRCEGQCLTMCQEMQRLQDEFKDEKQFRIVATSVDPTYDTPEVLRKHADRFDASPEQWLFLTGLREDVRNLAHDGFKLPWNEEDPLMHSERFVLVDRDGTIRGYYQVTEADQMEKLRKDIRALLGTGSA